MIANGSVHDPTDERAARIQVNLFGLFLLLSTPHTPHNILFVFLEARQEVDKLLVWEALGPSGLPVDQIRPLATVQVDGLYLLLGANILGVQHSQTGKTGQYPQSVEF